MLTDEKCQEIIDYYTNLLMQASSIELLHGRSDFEYRQIGGEITGIEKTARIAGLDVENSMVLKTIVRF
jgi:hypothetical protein